MRLASACSRSKLYFVIPQASGLRLSRYHLPPLESSASRGPPRCTVQLFVAQPCDRIELGGANRRNGAEEDADQGRDDDGDDGGEAGNGDAILGEETNGEGDGESDDDTEDAADEGDEDGLGEELEADLAVGSAHRFADANLANPGADSGKHDVHDADAADQQHDERYCAPDHGHDVGF